MRTAIPLLMAAIGACAQAHPQGAVTHSPPPRILAVPSQPSVPVHVLPSVPFRAAPGQPAPRLVRAPQERQPAQAYVSAGDYPASALANREEGRVRIRLDVGANGRVLGCTVIRSSGSRALDSATCMIMRRRARLTPAIDSNGQPAPGRVRDEVEWRLPE